MRRSVALFTLLRKRFWTANEKRDISDCPRAPRSTIKKKTVGALGTRMGCLQVTSMRTHFAAVSTERKNCWACAIDSSLLPAIRFSKWRTTNQNNTRHSKGSNAAVLALRTSEFYIIVRHLPSKLWSIS